MKATRLPSSNVPILFVTTAAPPCKKVITQKNARNIRVELKNVVYRPDSKLLSSLGQVEFRCSGRDSHFDIYSPDGWEKLVTKHFVGNRFLTLKDLELESHG